MDELLTEFLTETNESIDVLDVELVRLEQDPNSPKLLDNIFRLVHTIKGTCGFLGLPRLERVAHASENVLGKVRDNEIEVTPEAVTLILKAIDRIKEIIAFLEASQAEPEGDDSDITERLNAFAKAGAPPAPEAAAPDFDDAPEAPVAAAADVATTAADDEPDAAGTSVREDELEAAFRTAEGPVNRAVARAERDGGAMPEQEPAESPSNAAAAPAPAPASSGKPEPGESSVANQSIRVSVDLLENLMTMVSELVLTRNQLLQMVRGLNDNDFAVPLQRLSHVTTDLQEGVMKTRMQPIGNAWAKLPRIIRDLAVELGKKIDLDMRSADTELDRQVLEMIKDPLTHMVRNAADHGLEDPNTRLQLGKPETGRITLKAFHEGGHIIIEIRDDGRGLAVDAISKKVIANGLATEAEVQGMTDQKILQFIFRAGFSTAAQVTSVSGRGVGMDVVRTNIERIGGTVELKSKEGKGTSFTIKIPLTLAIVSALIVACGGERFAIPQLSVVELVGVSTDGDHRIETINETPVFRLRERLLPLVYLRQVMNMPVEASAGSEESAEAFIVVSQVGAHTFGIVVDRVFDTEEIVVKPAAPLLRHLNIYSGNTILGDGSVIMILDPNGIAASVGEASVSETDAAAEVAKRSDVGDDKVALLLFRAGGEEPKAVPLALIARLEEIPVSDIEVANGSIVVQYRGRLMPLIKLEEGCALKENGRQPVLVFADHGRSMGLLVDEITDIVEEHLEVELSAKRDGLIGTAVLNGEATAIIDTTRYLTTAFEDWFQSGGASNGGTATGKRVLLVDDSTFFLNLIAPVLTTAGYDVKTAYDADTALELRDGGEDFDVIVSDIEMPGMDGFEFAETIKKGPRWQNTPIVALSSRSEVAHLDRGREAGFIDYIAKFDRDALLAALSQTLSINGDAA